MNKNIEDNKNLSKNVMDGFKFKIGKLRRYVSQIEDQINVYRKKNKLSKEQKVYLSRADIKNLVEEVSRLTKETKEIKIDVIKTIADNIESDRQADFFDSVFKKLAETDGVLSAEYNKYDKKSKEYKVKEEEYKKNIKALIDFVVNNNAVQENIKKGVKKYNINTRKVIDLLVKNNNEFSNHTKILEYVNKDFSFDTITKFVRNSGLYFDIDELYSVVKTKRMIKNTQDFVEFLDLVKYELELAKVSDDEVKKITSPENILIKIAELGVKLDSKLIDYIVAFCDATNVEDLYNMVFNNTLGKDENEKVKSANGKPIKLKFDKEEINDIFQIRNKDKLKLTYKYVKSEILDKKIMTVDEVLDTILKGYIYLNNERRLITFDKNLINELIKPENNYVFSGKLMFYVMKIKKMIENQDDFAKFLRDCGSKVESLTLDELKDFYVKSFSVGKAIFNSFGNITKIASSGKKLYGNIDKLKNIDFNDSKSIDELKDNLKEIKNLYESGKNVYSKSLDNRKIVINFAIDQIGKEKIFNQIFDTISSNLADSLASNDIKRLKPIVKNNLSTILKFVSQYIDKSEKDPIDNILDHAESLLNKYQNLLKTLSEKQIKDDTNNKYKTKENKSDEINIVEVAKCIKDLYSEISEIFVTKDTTAEFKKIFIGVLNDQSLKDYVFDLIKPKENNEMTKEEKENLEAQNAKLKNIFDKNLSNVVGFVDKYIETADDDPIKNILDKADVIAPKVQNLLNVLEGEAIEKENNGQEPEKKINIVKLAKSAKELYSEVSSILVTKDTTAKFKEIFIGALNDPNIKDYVFDLIKPKVNKDMTKEEKEKIEEQNAKLKNIFDKNLSNVVGFVGKYIETADDDPIKNILDKADVIAPKVQNLLNVLEGEAIEKENNGQEPEKKINIVKLAKSAKELYSEVSSILVTKDTTTKFKEIFIGALNDPNIKEYVFELIKPKENNEMTKEEKEKIEEQNAKLKGIFNDNLPSVVSFVLKFIETSGNDPINKILNNADSIALKVQDLLKVLEGEVVEGELGEDKKIDIVKMARCVKDLYSEVSQTFVTADTKEKFKNIFRDIFEKASNDKDAKVYSYVFDLIKPKENNDMTKEEKENLKAQNAKLKSIFDKTVKDFSQIMVDNINKFNDDPIKGILENIVPIAEKAKVFKTNLDNINPDYDPKNPKNLSESNKKPEEIAEIKKKNIENVVKSAKDLYNKTKNLPFMNNEMIKNYSGLLTNILESQDANLYVFGVIKPGLAKLLDKLNKPETVKNKTIKLTNKMFGQVMKNTTNLLKVYMESVETGDPIEAALNSKTIPVFVDFYAVMSSENTNLKSKLEAVKKLFSSIEENLKDDQNKYLRNAYKNLITSVLDEINGENIDFVINNFIPEETSKYFPSLTTKLVKALFIKTINNIKTDIIKSDMPMTDLLNKMPDISGKTTGIIFGSINSFNKTFSENKMALAFICLIEVITVIPLVISVGVIDGLQFLGRYTENKIEAKIGPLFRKNKALINKDKNKDKDKT